MEKLDLKDRKILYHLYLDSRQSFSQIGKKVGLHKDVVAYRVKNLLEKKIIKNFNTRINQHKLGNTWLRFYLSFQYVSPKLKKEIIDYFVKNIYSSVVHSTEGQFDLIIMVYVRNIAKFSYTWEKIINRYRDNFSNQVFSIFCEIIGYKPTFLLDEEDARNDRFLYRDYDDGKIVKIDDLDEKILKIIRTNARIPTVEIAKKLNSSSLTINNRLQNMIKSGVISGFPVYIDYPKIGYKWYKVDIVLKDPSKSQKILNFIKTNSSLINIIKTIGYVDLELVFRFKSSNQLHNSIEEISEKFPEAIKNYTYFSITQTHKYQLL